MSVEPIELRNQVIDILLKVLKGGVTDTGVVETEACGSLERSYASVPDKLEAVRLLIEMGAI